mmetsp:Transcript_27223/g.63422  ORF Transcript_27223/g.63422 Transcript_27223/m.63422 type:complete len:136 (-) Transcript_27223:40-447(-)
MALGWSRDFNLYTPQDALETLSSSTMGARRAPPLGGLGALPQLANSIAEERFARVAAVSDLRMQLARLQEALYGSGKPFVDPLLRPTPQSLQQRPYDLSTQFNIAPDVMDVQLKLPSIADSAGLSAGAALYSDFF